MHPTPRPLHGQLVLIVEDEIDVAQRLAAILQRRGGAETLQAGGVRAAQVTIEAGARPHVIVLDHNLGSAETGTMLARWVHARPEQHTKIVSYSAEPRETILASCEGERLFELILTKGTTTINDLVRILGELLTHTENKAGQH
jgi:CheY-like chemotaxis protein